MTTFHNDKHKNESSADSLPRNDLINRWGNIISSYMALPGIRAFYPMSAFGSAGGAKDLIGGSPLTNNNDAQFNNDDFAPFCRYNGSTQYHSISDDSDHDIIGNETYIDSSRNGLTIGMWINPRDLPGAVVRYFSKGTTTGNDRAYALASTTSDQFTFIVSSDGTTTTQVVFPDTFVANSWYFVVGRFDPSAELKIWVGGEAAGLGSNITTTSVPATLNNSATGLAIGGQADGTQLSFIWASMCFLCAAYLEDGIIFGLYEQTKKVYGI